MPSYTFTWSDIDEQTIVELPNSGTAWKEAVRSLAFLLRDIAGAIDRQGELTLEVVDQEGNFVGSLCVTAKRSH